MLLTGKLSEAAEGNSLLGIRVLTSHIWLCNTVSYLKSDLKSLSVSPLQLQAARGHSQAKEDGRHVSEMLNTFSRL